MSKLHCPTCGATKVDKLAGDDDGDMYGCRACLLLFAMTVFTTPYVLVVEEEVLPIFEMTAVRADIATDGCDKGVSL